MAKMVFITPAARDDLDAILFYLQENWGVAVLENFLALYEAKISLIAEYPSRYPFIHEKNMLRKAVLTKHNIILYRDIADRIEVISVFDTRQDPGKIEKLT